MLKINYLDDIEFLKMFGELNLYENLKTSRLTYKFQLGKHSLND